MNVTFHILMIFKKNGMERRKRKFWLSRGSIVEDFFQRSKKIFPFFFFFFSPRQRKTRRTARVNTSVVVQQEAFNQRAWKILFTRSRTPHRSPLYVPICLFTPAHAAPLHARPTFHDRLLDFERVRFSFSPFPFWIGLKIWNLLTDSNRQRLLIWLLIGKFVSKLDQLEDSQTRRERKFLFDWFLESFFITNKILSKFSREKGVIKTFLILQS